MVGQTACRFPWDPNFHRDEGRVGKVTSPNIQTHYSTSELQNLRTSKSKTDSQTQTTFAETSRVTSLHHGKTYCAFVVDRNSNLLCNIAQYRQHHSGRLFFAVFTPAKIALCDFNLSSPRLSEHLPCSLRAYVNPEHSF